MAEKTSAALELRRSCLFSGDGALLALVRIEFPAGHAGTQENGDTDIKEEDNEKRKQKQKNRKKVRKNPLPVGTEETVAAYCARISSDCAEFAENVLFPKIREEYEESTDGGKRVRFVKYVYSVTYRKTELPDGGKTVISEARLTRGGKTLSAGVEGAVITEKGILPPIRVRGKKKNPSEVILPDKDGNNVRYFISSSGTVMREEIKPGNNCKQFVKSDDVPSKIKKNMI